MRSARQVADEIEGSSAADILLDKSYRSFTSGSDNLERLGLWDHDGQLTDLGLDVREELRLRDRARRLANPSAGSLIARVSNPKNY